MTSTFAYIEGFYNPHRLHALLHRYHIMPPERVNLFDLKLREWWESLHLTSLELVCVQCELDMLAFTSSQKRKLGVVFDQVAAQDERTSLLIQLPGVGKLLAVTILAAAIGDITRFPCAKMLVGYVGLGVRVHDRGERGTTGRITKTRRCDLRRAMVEAANHNILRKLWFYTLVYDPAFEANRIARDQYGIHSFCCVSPT